MLRPQSNLCRFALEMSDIWKIRKKGENGYRPIAVPASWNEQYEDLFFDEGPIEYSYGIDIQKAWEGKRLRLYFGAVNTESEVYVNDRLIGSNGIGYTPFEFEVGEFLKYGSENTVKVVVKNELSRDGFPSGRMPGYEENGNFPPTDFDFFPYGGIIRMPYLEAASKECVLDVGFRSDRSAPSKKIGVADISIEVTPESVGKDLEVQLGDLSKRESISSEKMAFAFEIDDARFWSLDDPFLYDLKVTILSEEAPLDEYKMKVGVRTVSADDRHILLNGKPVKFLGFGKHEEFPVEGQGTFKPLIVKDFDLMRWIGANSFRTSHYPYSEEWLDMADRLGFLVIDEAPHVGIKKYHIDNETTALQCADDVKRLIDRDKNHPSVVMWSVANEPDSVYPKADAFFKNLYDTAKESDPTRLVTMVNWEWASLGKDVAMKHFDVISVNRYYGWYNHQGRTDAAKKLLEDDLDALYEAYKRPVFLTEFGADAIAGFHSNPPQMFSEEYQSEYLEKLFEAADGKDFVSGIHVWAFADFKTAQNVHRPLFNHKGVFTRTRDPKQSAHVLRKLWKKGT